MSTRLRLGFHYHVPAVTRGGSIVMPGYLGRFVDTLARHCDRVVCFLHTPLLDEARFMDYALREANVVLVPIGPHTSVPKRTAQALWYLLPRLRAHRRNLDVMLIRGPSPLLPLVAWGVRPVPAALLLVGDYLAGMDDSPQFSCRKALIRFWARWNKWAQDRVARRSLTFVNSRQLFEELRPFVPLLVETRTTTLSEEDFFVREDTCIAPPYRLLYTGRISYEKGIFDLLHAVGLLLRRGEDVVLDLVGWPDGGDKVLKELEEKARELDISNRVFYHGYRPVGPELFASYRRADLFVIASRSEGFPRVVWEAMAHSLPVVATRVGGIPAFVSNACLLVEPCSPAALADGVRTLLHDGDLRRQCIREGLSLARQNTLEVRAAQMVREIKAWRNLSFRDNGVS